MHLGEGRMVKVESFDWESSFFVLRNIIAVIAILLVGTSVSAQETPPEKEPYAFEISAINAGLEDPEDGVRRDTPKATLDTFFSAIDKGDAEQAAHALNLVNIPESEQAERAPGLALMLAYVLKRRDLIDWRDVSDQPDARVLPDQQSTIAPYSRRSIELGEVILNRQPISINLQRFHVVDQEPVWLFTPSLVEQIPPIYRDLSDGLLGDWVPVRQRLELLERPPLWEWAIISGILLLSAAAGLTVFALAQFIARFLYPFRARWLKHTAVPLATVLAALVFRAGTLELVVLTGPVASNFDIGSEVILLVSGAWLFLRLLSTLTLWLSERFVVPLNSDDPQNRKTKTSVYLVRRLGLVATAIVAIGYVLTSLGAFDNFGLSILASAGALGVLLAIAAQPLLSNMVAGMQIALTDPVRIGDIVLYKDHWGTVEDISFAHVIIRTATETRLIVPHSEFLTNDFENWSKEGEPVWRIVKIPVDYRIDMDLLRETVDTILCDDPRLAAQPLVELAETSENSATVWIWVMGTDSITAWYLHNEVREKVMVFLRDHEKGSFLPRQRHLLES